MGEFKASFSSIRSGDIKHIYSGSPQVVKYRSTKPCPKKDQIILKDEDQHLDPHVLKTSEFVREHSCYIPRAPAFRVLSSDKVDEMVSRVTKPTTASRGIALRSVKAMLDDKSTNHSKYLGLQKIDEREQNMLNKRITYPTHSSSMRAYLTKKNLEGVKEKSFVHNK
ncbi:uncharacterized protein LOC132717935 [Ruditapes philippinarum]|uniref:uncharacterized protein LOC132717935 n=1 Tax=Ruditapes philippinarum TaxID=129788 RepID=UPI00295AA1D6|nr:uncharacterized protein LOC132717935 [Ruditapes philippinarum]